MAKLATSFYRSGNTGTRWLVAITIWSWLSAARLSAIEDPPGCSYANGGLGNVVEAALNFPLPQAHVGDTVQVYARLGMANLACRGVGNGSVYISTGKLFDYLINAQLDPGVLVSCPTHPSCTPGPYSLIISTQLVGVGVGTQLGFVPGAPRTVRIVSVNTGKVFTGTPTEQFASRCTASIGIVSPCVQITQQCDYPVGQNCFTTGAPIQFTGYVTNCGDIRLINVTVSASRTLLGGGLTDLNGFPLIQPLTVDSGQVVRFKGSFAPTVAETCGGNAANTFTVRGTDITSIGGPRASVTNSATISCNICASPCLGVTKYCDTVPIGSANTVSGAVTNCGNLAITNLVISDNLYGALATIPSLAPGASQTYSRLVTNSNCGSFPNIVTAAGTSVCGNGVLARATNTCNVLCPP